jgi:hypothetical protein
MKNTEGRSEQHSNENEDFVLLGLPASKVLLQSNDPKSNNQSSNHAQIPIESLYIFYRCLQLNIYHGTDNIIEQNFISSSSCPK